MTQHHMFSDQARHSAQGVSAQDATASFSGCDYSHDIDATKRDRFELLSAYLDGEVTLEERQLVRDWLSSDPAAKCLYQRLLQLRTGFQTTSVQGTCDREETIIQVFDCLNRRLRLACMAGAGACIMGVLGLLSGVFGPRPGLLLTTTVQQTDSSYPTLQVALDEPAFPLPGMPPSEPAGMGIVIPMNQEL